MGRATKWLKGLFGIKKNKEPKENSNSVELKDKKRPSFGHSGRDSDRFCHSPATIPPNITAAEAAWLRSFYNETKDEQNKQAIAVAAATAAAADAAVAAAQAAVAVVRLTSQGRGTMFGGGRERWAAVKIQAVFRGYLARKALKALKGLVKLQALVRGYLVRKQATATLHSMQALIRAQASIRAQRTRRFINNDDRFHSHFPVQKSNGRFDDTGSEHTVSAHSTRLSASFGTTTNTNEGSPKIVEMDTGRPKSKSWRTNTSVSDSGDNPCGQTLSSPLRCRVPAHLLIPDCRNFQDADWDLTGDECLFSTAQSTPRFFISDGSNAPVTPAKSVCVDSHFRQFTNFPSYMASTQSFKAKLRSLSAPKQRPEPGLKKRLSLNEMMESRNSLSGIRMQRSCKQVQEVISFKNVVMSKLDRSSDLENQKETTSCQRKW